MVLFAGDSLPSETEPGIVVWSFLPLMYSDKHKMLWGLMWPGQRVSTETQRTAVCHKGALGLWAHSGGLKDAIFPRARTTKPPFMNEVSSLLAGHTCQWPLLYSRAYGRRIF